MIYTVTFNPSLDYITGMDQLSIGMTNRSNYEQLLPGGKGINVSILLNHLNIENTALGFIAGFTGKEIENSLKNMGCKTDFITIENGFSRINVKLKAEEETEINGIGPTISTIALNKLMKQFAYLQEGDFLVLAGSIPTSMPDTIYQDIMQSLAHKKVKIIVDATKRLLVNVLPKHPFLIKPNNHELSELFGITIQTEQEVIHYAKELQKMGAQNVLISMAGDGAILVDETGKIHTSEAPKGTVINSVGAGDSMVAGFIAGYLNSKDYTHAFKMGIAAGSASAFSANLATKEEVETIYQTL